MRTIGFSPHTHNIQMSKYAKWQRDKKGRFAKKCPIQGVILVFLGGEGIEERGFYHSICPLVLLYVTFDGVFFTLIFDGGWFILSTLSFHS